MASLTPMRRPMASMQSPHFCGERPTASCHNWLPRHGACAMTYRNGRMCQPRGLLELATVRWPGAAAAAPALELPGRLPVGRRCQQQQARQYRRQQAHQHPGRCSHYGGRRPRFSSSAAGPPSVDPTPQEQQPKPLGDEEATAAAVRITAVGAVVNLLLSGAKGGAGVACGSSALVADAVHSLSDLASDAATIIAVRLARKPADDDHPYGHGRFETVGTLTVSGLVSLSGLAIGLHSYDALMALAAAAPAVSVDASAVPMGVAAGVAASSILAKEGLFQQTKLVAQRTRSDTLLANAWHHRSDALSSVVALGGVGGTIIGLPLLDPLAGLVVGGLVVRTGLEMGWDSIKVLRIAT